METKQTCFNLVNFEKWLRMQLKEQNMTVVKLSKISGVHPNTIHNYLAGKCEPTLFNATCIVTAFGYELVVIPK